jgi:hypothetical protein
MLRKRYVLLSALAALAAITAALVVHAGQAGDDPSQAPKSTFSVKQAGVFGEFPLYNAGLAVDGLPLVAVLRRTEGANYVSFIYGDCQATGETGCAPPAEIQVWPACLRNPSLYQSKLPGGPTFEETTVRGVPAASFEDGQRLELQTGISTVVIFGRSPEDVLRVADALRGVNVPVGPGEPLPAPASGAERGAVPCRGGS